MNRRGFLATAIGAALAPKELIKPVLSAPELGELYAAKLARSMIATKEVVSVNILNRAFLSAGAFQALVQPTLEKEFTRVYEQSDIDWGDLFKAEEVSN